FVLIIVFIFIFLHGIYATIRLFFPSKSSVASKKQIFLRIISDLELILKKSTISRSDIEDLQGEYLIEIGEYKFQSSDISGKLIEQPDKTIHPLYNRPSEPSIDIATIITGWYKKNTINFLLY